MNYTPTDSHQLTGDTLRNNLKYAFGVLRQEKMYQNDIQKIQQEKEELQSQKAGWKFQKVLTSPPQWMIITIIVLGLIIGYLTAGTLWGSRKRWSYSNLEPLLAGMLSIALFQAIIERKRIIACLKKKLTTQISDSNKITPKNQAVVIVAVLIVFVAVRLDSDFFSMLLWWLIYAICFIGTYRFMGWMECKFIHSEQWAKKTELYFSPKEEELEKEDLKKKSLLQTLRSSNLISFAHSTVPDNFWDSEELAALLSLMDNGPIDTLAEGIAVYNQKQFSENQRKALEEIYWKQTLQNEALQQQLHALEQTVSL